MIEFLELFSTRQHTEGLILQSIFLFLLKGVGLIMTVAVLYVGMPHKFRCAL